MEMKIGVVGSGGRMGQALVREIAATSGAHLSGAVEREGSAAPHVHFEGLVKGDYYIYAVGFDSTINEPVRGGLSVKITSKSGEKNVDIPVTE